jgi:hypothetical protein
MSKGSRPRPFSISLEELAEKHDAIFGKKPPKEPYVPPPLPDMEEKDKLVIDWGAVRDSDQGG